jgi:hypothetical protein
VFTGKLFQRWAQRFSFTMPMAISKAMIPSHIRNDIDAWISDLQSNHDIKPSTRYDRLNVLL